MGQLFKTLKSAWSTGSDRNVSLLAAGTAYYAFLAMVPMMAVAVLGYGLLADPETVARHADRIAEALPPSAAGLVTDQLQSVIETETKAKGIGLFVSLLVALFGARSGALAIITGMNIAFHAGEGRGFIKANLLAMALTVAAVLGSGVIAGATGLAAWLGAGIGGLLSFLVTAAAGFGGACLLYRYVPNRPSPAWRGIRRGAALFAIGWTVASSAFGFYAANFGSYNATYGSLGAVVVLLTWLYLTAFLLLFGAFFAAAYHTEAQE